MITRKVKKKDKDLERKKLEYKIEVLTKQIVELKTQQFNYELALNKMQAEINELLLYKNFAESPAMTHLRHKMMQSLGSNNMLYTQTF